MTGADGRPAGAGPRVRPGRTVTAAVLLVAATAACTGGTGTGTADLVVRYDDADGPTEVRVTIDDVACRSTAEGRDVRSGPLDSESPGGSQALVVGIRDALPGALLSLDLGGGRHYLSQEPIDADDGGFRLEAHPGVVVTGYLTDDVEYVAPDALLTGSVAC